MINRRERVAGELLKVISEIVREEIHDPGVGFITFLQADVSGDLRNAAIRYSVMGSDDQKKSTDIAIRNSTKFIKKRVNEKIRLRYAIDLKLERITGIDESFRVQEILNKIAKEKENKDGD